MGRIKYFSFYLLKSRLREITLILAFILAIYRSHSFDSTKYPSSLFDKDTISTLINLALIVSLSIIDAFLTNLGPVHLCRHKDAVPISICVQKKSEMIIRNT